MNVYQIVDWDKHFENSRSRAIEHCSFVAVPNKQHGMGFCQIASQPDGAAIYGIWHMMVGLCSQQGLPRAGWLTFNGQHDGRPMAVQDFCLKFRRTEKEIQRTLDFLAQVTGWLIVVESVFVLPSNCRPTADALPSNCRRTEGTEGTEGTSKPKVAAAAPEVVVSGLPDSLRTPRVTAQWQVWMKHRRTLKKSKSWPEMFNAQIEWLSKFDEPTAYEILSASIRNGWQGLFEPKENNGKTSTSANGSQHKGNPPQRVDRSIGTANEGTADLYRGLGRVAQVPNPQRPAA